MSNYTKATNFATKDGLGTSDPAKVIKGTEIDNEFNAIASAVSSKADTNSPALTGTPTAPTAGLGTNTTQLATCAFVLANAIPSGLISMWSGSIASIPSGWYLCDGSNSTPDLRDKFIIGAKQDETALAKTNVTGSLTQTGGTKDAINVSHTHTATVTDAGHKHLTGINAEVDPFSTPSARYGYADNWTNIRLNSQQNPGYDTYTETKTTGVTVANSTEGSSGTNQNLPPYYALAFIMKS